MQRTIGTGVWIRPSRVIMLLLGLLLLCITTTAVTARCPSCQCSATRVHSRYLLTTRDLPVSTQRVQRRLHVRRFFCDQPTCSRRTFAERLPELLPLRAQRTTLVDIERNAPFNPLPDRRSETVATWLQEYPGVQIITRARSTAFARGATDGAPTAVQVADRWHRLTNLCEVVERML